MKTKSISKTQLIIYSLIAMPLSIVGIPLYIYLPTFYVIEVNMDIIAVGSILFIARLSDVITDPFIGFLTDISVKKYSSRKPVMILGSLILIVSFYFILNPNKDYASFWLLFFSIFIYLGWSMINIPYLTFSSEISTSYYAKSILNSTREISTIFGMLLALILPYFFNYDLIQDKLNLLYIVFIILFIPFFLITILKLKTNSELIKDKEYSLKNIKDIYLALPKLKYLQTAYFFNNLANAIPATLFLLFIEVVIKNKEFSELILVLYFFAGLLALPFWTVLSKKTTKETIWKSSIILACISFIFVIFLEEGQVVYFGIISFVSGLCLGADIAFPTSIQSDLVQKQKDLSGLIFGIWTMITKLALAFSIVITFTILHFVDFQKENLTQTSILTLTLLYGFLPVVLKLLALLFISKTKSGKS